LDVLHLTTTAIVNKGIEADRKKKRNPNIDPTVLGRRSAAERKRHMARRSDAVAGCSSRC